MNLEQSYTEEMTTLLSPHVQFTWTHQEFSTFDRAHQPLLNSTQHTTQGDTLSSHLVPLLSPPTPNLSHISHAQRSTSLSAEKASSLSPGPLHSILHTLRPKAACLFFQLNSLSILTSHMCCKLIKDKQCISSPQQTKQSGMYPIFRLVVKRRKSDLQNVSSNPLKMFSSVPGK